MPIPHDLHVHTYLSACCPDKVRHRPAAILAEAERLGRRLIGFSDHVWANPLLPAPAWYQPQDERQILRLREDLKSVSSPVRVLVGCEADTASPGRFGISPAFAATLDFVNLSCSHFHMRNFVAQPADDSPGALGKHMLEFFRSAAGSGLATAIAHPLLPFGHLPQYEQAIASLGDAELLDAFHVAAAHGVALEITAKFISPSRGVAWGLETPQRVLSLAKAAGCRFTFGSDAHTLEQMARLDAVDVLARGAGITGADLAPLARA